jgi:hypothetical protein
MKKKSIKKIKITITDPWDSKESIIGFFDRPILVGNLVSLLVRSEGGEWIALLPRYKGQQLTNEMNSKQKFVINIAKLANVGTTAEQIATDHILFYASGSAEIID